MIKKVISLIITTVIAHSMSSGINPFKPYKPFNEIDWSLNWSLGKDSTNIAYRPENMLTRSLLPIGAIATSIAYNDNQLDKSIVKLGSINSNPMYAANTLQYLPIVTLYALKGIGVESRSDWSRMFTADLFSVALMAGINNTIKYTVKRERPDGSARNSYPSGHTATAFMAAQMLHKEYGETISPWISVGGYGMAATTGIFRVIANRHWVSDVLCGAAVGILSTELAYDITDLIFGKQGLLRPIVLPDIDDNPHWKFALSSDYSVSSTVFSSQGYGNMNAKPACSAGIEATWMAHYIGPTLYAGITQMKWIGSDDIYLPHQGSVADVYTIEGGLALYCPLLNRLSINGKVLAGYSPVGSSYSFVDIANNPIEWDIPAGMRYYSNIGFTYRTSAFSAISVHGGWDYYDKVWRSYVIGTSFNFVF